MEHAVLVHSPEYANWTFDESHPTQGRRFLHARNQIMLEAQKRHLNVDEIHPEMPHTNDLLLVHDPMYVHDVTIRGKSDEWDGQRHELGELAKLFVGGTLTALDALLDKKTLLAINLAGAKHHAMRDYSSGFCIFADFAIAATKATELGERVAIFDIDAHHGDGTEMLLKANKNVMTFSVHQYGIFPGTGLISDYKNRAYNFPLTRDSDDEDLMTATESFFEACAEFEPTMKHRDWELVRLIRLTKSGRNKFIILHEIAHHIVWGRESHGAEFADVLLQFTTRYLGKPDADKLANAFNEKRVRVMTKTKKARVPRKRETESARLVA